jgi:spectinomycin phosphotransferase
MKFEPSVDRGRLIATVHEAYGLPIEELAFVPVGEAAVCYSLHFDGSPRYFLKLWPNTRVGRASASRRDTTLRLTRALYDRRLYPRVPYPIPTRDGALSATFGGTPFALFPFLPGQAAPPLSDLPLPSRDEMARTLAALHRATPALADVLPPRETFDIPFEADLRRSIEAVEHLGPRERPGLLILRDAILPRRDAILDQLTRLHHLRQTLRHSAGSFVLCHGDLGGDNLLVDDQGQVSVLDWDGATVAPAEHDLHWTLGPGFGRFLRVYEEAAGPRLWHLDQFAFWLLRRSVADLTDDLLRLLEGSTSRSEDEYLLDHLETWGFAQWAILDETLDGIAEALRHYAS